MTRPTGQGAADVAWEIAPDVFCLGPWGRTQTVVYFVRSGSSWVLIDAGWANDASRIERAAGSLLGSDSRPAAILLTHCHPDHAGSALPLARTWDCAVYMHPEELPIATGDFAAMVATAGPLDRRVVLPLMRAMGQRRREAVLARSSLGEVARTFDPDAGVPGLPGWECIATPGHTPGHVSYFRPGDRVLISGDALVTLRLNSWSGLFLGRPGLSGPPWYTTWSRRAARESVERLARLESTVLAGGHGRPMTGTGTTSAVSAFAGLATDR
jgi:glyoxylase-like metal-dependent hydrolase (beta-lactamase superfamily II)